MFLTQERIGQYWQDQDFMSSARLHLQNWIWSYTLGYVLHPQIDIPKNKPIRVADIACGNGAWMLDLHRERPNATLDGFDITASTFPAEGWWPSGFKHHIWNCFHEVPEEFVGVFDVVHIRTIYTAVVNNKVEPLIDNLLKMLKPGGYLQWDEGDATTFSVDVAPGSQTTGEASKELSSHFRTGFLSRSNLRPDWVYTLPSKIKERGGEMLAEEPISPRRELQRAWNDNALMVFMGLLPFYSDATDDEGVMSRSRYIELVEKAVDECSKGAFFNFQTFVFVARKAI